MKTINAKNEEVKRDAKGRVIGFTARSGKVVTPETALAPESLPPIANTQDELLSGDPRKEKRTKGERDALVNERYRNAIQQQSANKQENEPTKETSMKTADEIRQTLQDLEKSRDLWNRLLDLIGGCGDIHEEREAVAALEENDQRIRVLHWVLSGIGKLPFRQPNESYVKKLEEERERRWQKAA